MPAPVLLRHPSSLDHDTGAASGAARAHRRDRARARARGPAAGLGGARRRSAATREMLEAIHPPQHVAFIERLCAAGGGLIDIDTRGRAPGRATAALHAVGGACDAGRPAARRTAPRAAASAHRPPGPPRRARRGRWASASSPTSRSRRSARSTSHGAAARADPRLGRPPRQRDERHLPRDATEVLFASIHQSPLYPGTGPASDVGRGAGEGYTVNLPVPAGSGDDAWVSLVEHVVRPLARAYEPRARARVGGLRRARRRPAGGLPGDRRGLRGDGRLGAALAEELGAPLGIVLEGGYELAALARVLRGHARGRGRRRGAVGAGRCPCTRSRPRRSSGSPRAGRRSRSRGLLDAGRRRRRWWASSAWSPSSSCGRVVRCRAGRVCVWPGTVAGGGTVSVGRRRRRRAGVVAIELVTGGAVCGGGGAPSAGAAPRCAVVAGGSSSVSWTNATASAAPATATITARIAAGMCQFGVGARRVRAGAPHSRHQSWSGPIGAAARAGRRAGLGLLRGAHPSSARLRSYPSSSAPAASSDDRTCVGGSASVASCVGSSSNGAGSSCAWPGRAGSGVERSGTSRCGGAALPAAGAVPGAGAGDGRERPGGLAHLETGCGRAARGRSGAEARVAAVQRAAARARGDARLAQLVDLVAVVERALERAQLAVDRRGARAIFASTRSGRSRPKRRRSKTRPPRSRKPSSRARRR